MSWLTMLFCLLQKVSQDSQGPKVTEACLAETALKDCRWGSMSEFMHTLCFCTFAFCVLWELVINHCAEHWWHSAESEPEPDDYVQTSMVLVRAELWLLCSGPAEQRCVLPLGSQSQMVPWVSLAAEFRCCFSACSWLVASLNHLKSHQPVDERGGNRPFPV
jgi:hypothetical protein